MASPDFGEHEKGSHSDELSQDSKPLDTEKAEEDAGHVGPVVPLDEYPHGARLAVIVVSLMLSTFLVALDNVSDCCAIRIKTYKLTLSAQDYYWHRNSENYRRVSWFG
jgi:hypothetical protein